MGSSLRKQQRSGGRVEVRKVRRKRTLVTSCHGSSLRSSRCSRNAPVGYWQASRFAQPRLTGPTTADTSPGWRPPEAERGLAEHATGRAELRVVAVPGGPRELCLPFALAGNCAWRLMRRLTATPKTTRRHRRARRSSGFDRCLRSTAWSNAAPGSRSASVNYLGVRG